MSNPTTAPATEADVRSWLMAHQISAPGDEPIPDHALVLFFAGTARRVDFPMESAARRLVLEAYDAVRDLPYWGQQTNVTPQVFAETLPLWWSSIAAVDDALATAQAMLDDDLVVAKVPRDMRQRLVATWLDGLQEADMILGGIAHLTVDACPTPEVADIDLPTALATGDPLVVSAWAAALRQATAASRQELAGHLGVAA